jgi:capsular exopolysaccharide synthesis family protein
MKTVKGARTPAIVAERPAVEHMHLTDYLRMLYKWRWIAVPVFLIVFVAGAVNTLRQTPIYEGHVQLLIAQDTPSIGKIDQMFQTGDSYYNDDFYQTQYRILQSRSLAKQTIEAMHLWNVPRLGNGPMPKSSLSLTGLVSGALSSGIQLLQKSSGARSEAPRESAAPDTARDEPAAQSSRVDEFLSGLSINPVRNSRIVEIRYDSTDPEFAAQAANAVAKAYIQQNLELKFNSSKDAADWLGGRLAEQRRAVEASEAALQAFKEKNGAVSVADTASNIVVQRLTDLNGALTKAKTDHINKEALLNQLQAAEGTGAIDTLPAVVSNEYIQKLKSSLSDLQRQQAQLAQRYDDKHPEMIKARMAVQGADAKLRSEIAKVIDGVKSDYQTALAQERELQSALNAQKNEALSMNRKGIEFGVLQREAESNRQIYESLLQRTKETDISSELRTTNVRVVDMAEVPRAPVSPNVQRDISLSFAASLVLAIGLAFFVEYLDNRIKTPPDMKTHLGIPFLGMIPTVAKSKDGASPLLHNDVPANFAEAFKTVRTSVLFSSAEAGLRTLVVTSAGPGEGKSLVSANLAIALAQAGQRVLLVDADMRRPRVHEIFSTPQEPGFSNLLTSNAKASEVIRKSSQPGLWILGAGHIPPNPAELLGSLRYTDFLSSLEDHFDWAVIDTPPVLVVTDSLIAANQATGVVFVVGADQTSRHAARTAVEQLDAANARLIGSVLNKANVLGNPYYYSSYYRKDYARYYVKSAS